MGIFLTAKKLYTSIYRVGRQHERATTNPRSRGSLGNPPALWGGFQNHPKTPPKPTGNTSHFELNKSRENTLHFKVETKIKNQYTLEKLNRKILPPKDIEVWMHRSDVRTARFSWVFFGGEGGDFFQVQNSQCKSIVGGFNPFEKY